MRSTAPGFGSEFDRTMVGRQEAWWRPRPIARSPDETFLQKVYRIPLAIATKSSNRDSISIILFGSFPSRTFRFPQDARNRTGRGGTDSGQRTAESNMGHSPCRTCSGPWKWSSGSEMQDTQKVYGRSVRSPGLSRNTRKTSARDPFRHGLSAGSTPANRSGWNPENNSVPAPGIEDQPRRDRIRTSLPDSAPSRPP